MNNFTEKFRNHVNNRLNQSKIKITDLVLEELFSFALEDSGQTHVYESGSHRKGGDISIDGKEKSVKSGQRLNGFITISSFRLSRYKNLTDMLNFIDGEGKNFDEYYLLARTENQDTVKYSFYTIPSNIFTASTMNWVEKRSTKGKNVGNLTGWKTVDDSNIQLSIEISMSCQLWIHIKEEYISQFLQFEIERNIADLGKQRFVA
jgi:hypothetical protein